MFSHNFARNLGNYMNHHENHHSLFPFEKPPSLGQNLGRLLGGGFAARGAFQLDARGQWELDHLRQGLLDGG